jgi:hypothetical protein
MHDAPVHVSCLCTSWILPSSSNGSGYAKQLTTPPMGKTGRRHGRPKGIIHARGWSMCRCGGFSWAHRLLHYRYPSCSPPQRPIASGACSATLQQPFPRSLRRLHVQTIPAAQSCRVVFFIFIACRTPVPFLVLDPPVDSHVHVGGTNPRQHRQRSRGRASHNACSAIPREDQRPLLRPCP